MPSQGCADREIPLFLCMCSIALRIVTWHTERGVCWRVATPTLSALWVSQSTQTSLLVLINYTHSLSTIMYNYVYACVMHSTAR